MNDSHLSPAGHPLHILQAQLLQRQLTMESPSLSRIEKRRIAVPVVALLALLAGTTMSSAPAVAQNRSSELCRQRIVKDYEQPLRDMPRLHLPPKPFPPANGELPFGPPGIELHSTGLSRLVVEGGRFGYRLTAARATSRSGLLKHAVDLGWHVNAALWSVDSQGTRKKLVAQKDQYFGRTRDFRRIEFAHAAPPGLYRYDIKFWGKNRDELASYSMYYRVLRFRVSFRLATSGLAFRAGETVFGRFENIGTASVLLPDGPALTLEHQEAGGEWITIPATASGDATAITDPEIIYAGRATECSSFTIPSDASIGRYRFNISVEPIGHERSRRSATEEFTVAD